MTDQLHSPPDRTVYLMLRMKPPWVFIDEIRRFVESFCTCACPGQGREAQLALAVHELMQNAIPHARGGHVDLVLEVEPCAERVSIKVSNPCTDGEFAALGDRIAAMYREPDALTSYLAAMRESPATTRGGLGLPRVRFEAQLDIRASREGDRLTVEAFGALLPPPLAAVGGRHA